MTPADSSQSGGLGPQLMGEMGRALAECQSQLRKRRAEVDLLCDWLVEQGFPYDWHTEKAAPRWLLLPLAEAWVRKEQAGEEPPTVEDWMETLQLEQVFGQ